MILNANGFQASEGVKPIFTLFFYEIIIMILKWKCSFTHITLAITHLLQSETVILICVFFLKGNCLDGSTAEGSSVGNGINVPEKAILEKW